MRQIIFSFSLVLLKWKSLWSTLSSPDNKCKNLNGCLTPAGKNVILILSRHDYYYQARNLLGIPRGAKSFLRGAQNFSLCPIDLNYVQNIFPGGAKNILGGASPPCGPLVTSLITTEDLNTLKPIYVNRFHCKNPCFPPFSGVSWLSIFTCVLFVLPL